MVVRPSRGPTQFYDLHFGKNAIPIKPLSGVNTGIPHRETRAAAVSSRQHAIVRGAAHRAQQPTVVGGRDATSDERRRARAYGDERVPSACVPQALLKAKPAADAVAGNRERRQVVMVRGRDSSSNRTQNILRSSTSHAPPTCWCCIAPESGRGRASAPSSAKLSLDC